MVVETTVQTPINGDSILGLDVWSIFPDRQLDKYVAALFRAVTSAPHRQWIKYKIGNQPFVALIEYQTDDLCFVVHEAFYDKARGNKICKMISQASRNFVHHPVEVEVAGAG